MNESAPAKIDRRTTLKWMLAVSTAASLVEYRQSVLAATSGQPPAPSAKGYGTDPDLTKTYQPGDFWPLTFTAAQRRTAAALCDAIIPADAESPSASSVGVVDFLDEWVSAPYPQQQDDRKILLPGLEWLDAESRRRFGRAFAEVAEAQMSAICEDICYEPKAQPRFAEAARFFARYRDLTAGGFYTTPQGTKDLKYVGNVPLPRFDGPPLEVLKKVGLA